LAAIRSLGKAGYEVHVVGDTWFTVGFWSRYAHRRILSPDPAHDPDGFAAALTRHLRAIRQADPDAPKPALLAMEDATMRYLVEHDDAFAPLADFVIPDRAAFDTASDKAATMNLAEQLGIPHPCSEVVESPASLVAAVSRMAPREYITKPLHGEGSRG